MLVECKQPSVVTEAIVRGRNSSRTLHYNRLISPGVAQRYTAATVHSGTCTLKKKRGGELETKAIFLPGANGRGGKCSRSSISPIHMQRHLVALGKGTKSSSSMFAEVTAGTAT